MKHSTTVAALVTLAIAGGWWLPTSVSAAHTGDRCHLRELDLCAASAAGANRVPVNDDEIDKYCAAGEEARTCVNTYLDQCATPIQRELFTWATKDPLKSSAEFCKRGSSLRTDYLKNAPCLAKAHGESKKCLDDIHAALEKLEKAKFADRLPTACCTYHRYLACSSAIVEDKCGRPALEHGLSVVQKKLGGSLELICTGFAADSDECKRLLPASGTKASGNSKSIVGRLFSAYIQA